MLTSLSRLRLLTGGAFGVSTFMPITGGEFTGTVSFSPIHPSNTSFGASGTMGTITTGAFQNTAYGSGVLAALTTGDDNTGIGYTVLASNTGTANTGIGAGTLNSNVTGNGNTASGNASLKANVSGSDNCSYGSAALIVATGSQNTSFGALSFLRVSTGIRNVSMGYRAGQNLDVGDDNTFIGTRAGELEEGGDFNICLGKDSNSSAVGSVGQCTLGDSNIVNLRCNDTTISALSDSRDKTNVVSSTLGLDYINAVRPVEFDWERRVTPSDDGKYKRGERDVGFIAQELLATEVSFDARHVMSVQDDNPERLEAAYLRLFPILVQAVKDLSAEVEELKRTKLNKTSGTL